MPRKSKNVDKKETTKPINGRQDLKLQSTKADKSEKKTKKLSDAKVTIQVQSKPELVHTAAELIAARMAGYEAAQIDAKVTIDKLVLQIAELKDKLADAVSDVSYLHSIIKDYLNKGLISKFAFALAPVLFGVALTNIVTDLNEEDDEESNLA